jgi:hypothetical protein
MHEHGEYPAVQRKMGSVCTQLVNRYEVPPVDAFHPDVLHKRWYEHQWMIAEKFDKLFAGCAVPDHDSMKKMR